MGLGKRHEPLDNVPHENPGPGAHETAGDAATNPNPSWKFGKVERKDPKREDFPGPADQKLPSHIAAGRKT
jgi:hypothetical protein